MRPRVALRVLAIALALAVLPLASVYATHSPTVQSVLDVAAAYQMGCEGTASEVQCDAGDFDGTWHNHATIKPGSANLNLTSLYTVASVTWVPLGQAGPYWEGWLRDMQTAACGGSREVASFVAGVAALTTPNSTVPPLNIPNECNLTGGMSQAAGARSYDYWINAVVIVPPPPTSSPTPAPTPTPVVTPPPTATPRPTPSPTPRPSATPSPTGTSSPTSTASSTASPTASPTAPPTPTPRPSATSSPTPEQTVAGITFAPEPSAPVPDEAEDRIHWAASVHGPEDVSTDPVALAASAGMAMLLLLMMGFAGELFNNTVKANYDELIGLWHKSWLSRLAAAWAKLWKLGP